MRTIDTRSREEPDKARRATTAGHHHIQPLSLTLSGAANLRTLLAMDIRGYVLAVILVLSCIASSYLAVAEQGALEGYGEISPEMKITYLEKMIKKDIERELQDILDLENQVNSNLSFIKTKKRQLEIKKRQPLQCFLNIVSCWKRK